MANTQKLKQRAEILLYLEQSDKDALRKLSDKTGVPVQDYLREGVQYILNKHSKRKGR